MTKEKQVESLQAIQKEKKNVQEKLSSKQSDIRNAILSKSGLDMNYSP